MCSHRPVDIDRTLVSPLSACHRYSHGERGTVEKERDQIVKKKIVKLETPKEKERENL
jgi:hypothetical protein